jgi:hypothetical protein
MKGEKVGGQREGCWGGERIPLASKENHTKGGMKKLLLCTNIHALTVPTLLKRG